MKRRTLLKWLAAALFVGVLWRVVDWSELAAVFRGVDWRYAGAALAFSFAMVAASCWKWWVILRLQGLALPFGLLYRWYFIGYFYSNFLPSNVGGDVARAALAGRRANSYAGALVSVFAERLTGLLCLLALAVACPLTHASLRRLPALWIPAAAALGVLAVLGAAAVFGRRMPWGAWAGGVEGLAARLAAGASTGWRIAAAELVRKTGDRVGLAFARGAQLWHVLRARPGAALSVAGLTLLFYAMTAVNVTFCYRAFGVRPDTLMLLRVLPAALIVAMLPLTPGSLGLAEGSYVYYFGLTGLGVEATLAASVLLRLKVLMLGAIGMAVQAFEPWRPGGAPVSADGGMS